MNTPALQKARDLIFGAFYNKKETPPTPTYVMQGRNE
jgi:hypothetical protein